MLDDSGTQSADRPLFIERQIRTRFARPPFSLVGMLETIGLEERGDPFLAQVPLYGPARRHEIHVPVADSRESKVYVSGQLAVLEHDVGQAVSPWVKTRSSSSGRAVLTASNSSLRRSLVPPAGIRSSNEPPLIRPSAQGKNRDMRQSMGQDPISSACTSRRPRANSATTRAGSSSTFGCIPDYAFYLGHDKVLRIAFQVKTPILGYGQFILQPGQGHGLRQQVRFLRSQPDISRLQDQSWLPPQPVREEVHIRAGLGPEVSAVRGITPQARLDRFGKRFDIWWMGTHGINIS